MIILDTHILIWWMLGLGNLSLAQRMTIEWADEIGISVFSFWEVSKLVQGNRIALGGGLSAWLRQTIATPKVRVLNLTPEILADSIALPGNFHKDPADQIIVATARVHGCSLLTVDEKIVAYPHVQVVP